jgi:hypothetical protein
MGKVTAGDGSALSFLCARVLKKHTDDPSPPVTRVLVSTDYAADLTPLRGQK